MSGIDIYIVENQLLIIYNMYVREGNQLLLSVGKFEDVFLSLLKFWGNISSLNGLGCIDRDISYVDLSGLVYLRLIKNGF